MRVSWWLPCLCVLAGCARAKGEAPASSAPTDGAAQPVPTTSSEADASAVRADDAGVAAPEDAGPSLSAVLDDATICRLRGGCDGGPDCTPEKLCTRCFAMALPETRKDCRELYLLNGCQDRCRGLAQKGYEACERKCRTVWPDPSSWPPPRR